MHRTACLPYRDPLPSLSGRHLHSLAAASCRRWGRCLAPVAPAVACRYRPCLVVLRRGTGTLARRHTILRRDLAGLRRATHLRCTHPPGCTKACRNISRLDDRRHPSTRTGFTTTEIQGILGPQQPRHRTAPMGRPTCSAMERRNSTPNEDYRIPRRNKRESREEYLETPSPDQTVNRSPLPASPLRATWTWADQCRARTTSAGRRNITPNARVDRSSTKMHGTYLSENDTRGKWR